MSLRYTLSDIWNLDIALPKTAIVFIRWDLWAWKTALSQMLIRRILGQDISVTSPTYTYYNRYESIYHFDLYRLKNYDEFFAIGGEDILDNHDWIILIEWPELIMPHYTADLEIVLKKTDIPDEREISVIYESKPQES